MIAFAYDLEIVEIAQTLGVTITRAKIGSEIYHCWADRVAQAWEYELDLNHARNQRGAPSAHRLTVLRDAAVAQANAYAI